MASRSVAEDWLAQLTNTPTAPGHEDEVIAWVVQWVSRRPDLRLRQDEGGNLMISQRRRSRRAPLVAVAHMDHPGFVVTDREDAIAHIEFRGGVDAVYFENARVRFHRSGAIGRIVDYDGGTQSGSVSLPKGADVGQGDIGIWAFRARRPRKGRFLAPACDDLAGAAAALAALDRARRDPALGHMAVLLTRAEEVGFVGAIHAAKTGTIPPDSRVISIEASRASAVAPIGAGPVIRVGDAASIFDAELTNQITSAVRQSGINHQRKLMDGGSCEATAFGAYGLRATGLCLPLGNWHNRGNLDQVEAGTGEAQPMEEEISLDDYHGLIDLLLIAARVEEGSSGGLRDRLDSLYEETKGILG